MGTSGNKTEHTFSFYAPQIFPVSLRIVGTPTLFGSGQRDKYTTTPKIYVPPTVPLRSSRLLTHARQLIAHVHTVLPPLYPPLAVWCGVEGREGRGYPNPTLPLLLSLSVRQCTNVGISMLPAVLRSPVRSPTRTRLSTRAHARGIISRTHALAFLPARRNSRTRGYIRPHAGYFYRPQNLFLHIPAHGVWRFHGRTRPRAFPC